MIRVLCVEDDPQVRTYLATRLAAEPDIAVVGAVPDVTRALIYLHRDEIHVVLLDYCLDGRDGGDLLQAMAPWGRQSGVAQDCPAVLFCTGLADAGFESKARVLGAHGVVAKERMHRDLIPAVRTVAAGGTWFDSSSESLA